MLSSYEGHREAVNGQDSWSVIQRRACLWTRGCWLARQLHRLKASTAMDLSLRNLVSGFECGKVFPAGVGPGSPSRDDEPGEGWTPVGENQRREPGGFLGKS